MHECGENIGFLIKQISDRMQACADAEMKCSELTYSQFQVLGYLARQGGEASQKEIGQYLGVSHPTVVGLVSRLERKDFVETGADERDRRRRRVRLTAKARALGEAMRENWQLSEKILRGQMTPAEVSELIRLLHIVSANLAEAKDPGQDRKGAL